jgi:hypothetical protein
MQTSRRLVGLTCQLTVSLWIATYLALGVVEALPEEPAPELPARVRATPPPISPAPASPDRPAPAPARMAEPTPVQPSDLVAGAELLDGAGGFPALLCSYDDFPSFRDYARAMTALGARFVVVSDRRIVGDIDLDAGILESTRPPLGFSPRARDYTGEPGLANLTRAARERFGRDAVVMMLVPREVDAGLFGGIARALDGRGERHDGYTEIRGRYQRGPGGGVRLRVDSGLRADGSEASLDLLFDLGAIARAGHAPVRPQAGNARVRPRA